MIFELLSNLHVYLSNLSVNVDKPADNTHRQGWSFDRPWFDRTQRFVPPEPVRAELFRRIDQLNTERFELERDMMVDIIAYHLPGKGLTKTAFTKRDPFTDHAHRQRPIRNFYAVGSPEWPWARVRKKGSCWYPTN